MPSFGSSRYQSRAMSIGGMLKLRGTSPTTALMRFCQASAKVDQYKMRTYQLSPYIPLHLHPQGHIFHFLNCCNCGDNEGCGIRNNFGWHHRGVKETGKVGCGCDLGSRRLSRHSRITQRVIGGGKQGHSAESSQQW